jgi:hypothetical protein
VKRGHATHEEELNDQVARVVQLLDFIESLKAWILDGMYLLETVG